MAGGIYRGIVVPHAPRMGRPEIVPDFQKAAVQGMVDLGADIRRDRPDVIVICSTHYVSTFNWHASTVARHKGSCVAMEAPEMIAGELYDYPGDPALGQAIVDEIKASNHPAVANAAQDYSWDYATWVPIHYMDPGAEIPVVTVPVVLASDLEESFAAGEAVDRACRRLGRRAVIAASSSFTHKVIRGPAAWPTPERVEADKKFIGLMLDGKLQDIRAWFPDYAELVHGEMGGRALAFMFGGLAAAARAAGTPRWQNAQFGPYAQSSASGNASVSMKMAA